jgi:hypothetical protein
MPNTPIRTRPLGTNRASDRYTRPRVVDSLFRDLALFIAHTGFTNIRAGPAPPHSVPCRSLGLAWRLQGVLHPRNEVWYSPRLRSFGILQRVPWSTRTRQLLFPEDPEDLEDDLGPYDVAFCPPPLVISVDAFIERAVVQYVQTTLDTAQPLATYGHQRDQKVRACVRSYHRTTELHAALLLLFPSSLGLSRSTVYNRLAKIKRAGRFFVSGA